MRFPNLARATVSLCLLCALWNAFFYLNDPNYPAAPGTPIWISVLAITVVYGLFAMLGWNLRRSKAATIFIFLMCVLSVAFLLLGRGRDWYGSMTVPNYYNQVIRLGTTLGGLAQVGCLLLAVAGVSILKLSQFRKIRRHA
jgi:hypothetical protein